MNYEWKKIKEAMDGSQVVYIFGAGVYGFKILERIIDYGYNICFIDNDTSKCGNIFHDVMVYPVEKAVTDEKNKVIIIPKSKYSDEMKRQLETCGVDDDNIFICHKALIPWKRLRFEVQIAEHCNLKCKCCDHISPLAEPELLDINEYEDDLKRLSYLSNGEAERIFLLGGEPFLHPQLADFCIITRQYFPNAPISIITNGLLVNKQDADFWKVLIDNNIILRITDYPINIDYKKMEESVRSYGVNARLLTENLSTFVCKPLDPNGNYDYVENFTDCPSASYCILLSHGKLYPCAVPANIKHLNKYHNMCFELSENDGADIYKAEQLEELMENVSSPIPFCRYCAWDCRKMVEWGQSKMSIDEWVKQ